MAANVLNSSQAVKMSLYVIRALRLTLVNTIRCAFLMVMPHHVVGETNHR